jgi:hypothetical protein
MEKITQIIEIAERISAVYIAGKGNVKHIISNDDLITLVNNQLGADIGNDVFPKDCDSDEAPGLEIGYGIDKLLGEFYFEMSCIDNQKNTSLKSKIPQQTKCREKYLNKVCEIFQLEV